MARARHIFVWVCRQHELRFKSAAKWPRLCNAAASPRGLAEQRTVSTPPFRAPARTARDTSESACVLSPSSDRATHTKSDRGYSRVAQLVHTQHRQRPRTAPAATSAFRSWSNGSNPINPAIIARRPASPCDNRRNSGHQITHAARAHGTRRRRHPPVAGSCIPATRCEHAPRRNPAAKHREADTDSGQTHVPRRFVAPFGFCFSACFSDPRQPPCEKNHALMRF